MRQPQMVDMYVRVYIVEPIEGTSLPDRRIFMVAARSVKCKILWFENSTRVKIINK